MVTAPTDAVAFFSKAAASFHDSYRTDANRIERVEVWRAFLDRFVAGPGFAYDLGCGSGILACDLGRRGIETVGVDGAPGMLAIARRAASEAALANVSFNQHRLPVADPEGWRQADVVISSSALEYLDSLPDVLASIHQMLRAGGVLVFSVSNRDSLSRRAVRVVHRLTGRPEYFGLLKQFSTVATLKVLLEAAGYRYLDGAYFARADRINRMLGHVVPVRFASNMIIVAGQRL
jgi:SAM-dependent methyltransferase